MDICTIEHLPPEILELIFQELSLKDISNCAQTCQHWNYCIEAFFRNQGRIIVCTGDSPFGNWGQRTEVIDLTNSQIKFDHLEEVSERFGAVGGLLDGFPVICGGYSSFNDEYLRNGVNIGQHTTIATQLETNLEPIGLLEKRSGAATVAINQNTLWITGGENEYVDLNSTEFLTFLGEEQTSKKGPDLPFTIERHGMVIYNENSIYIIGGYQDGALSGKSWIVNLSSKGGFKIKEGPSLNIARSKLSGSVIVTSPRVQGLVVLGGYNGVLDEYCPAIIELKPNPMEWIILDQELEYARFSPVAFIIPDYLTCCKINQKPDATLLRRAKAEKRAREYDSKHYIENKTVFNTPPKNLREERRQRLATNQKLREIQQSRDELRTQFDLHSHEPGLFVLDEDLKMKTVQKQFRNGPLGIWPTGIGLPSNENDDNNVQI